MTVACKATTAALLPCALAALLLVLSGCADEETSTRQCDTAGVGGDGGQGGSAPPDCDPGQIVGPDGACMAVGIQGCAEQFIEDDGLCHPRIDKCPPGTIPKFDEGCVPVGIPASGCPELFMEEDGLCHPSMDKCPAGTFAAPLLGCVPIDGPDGCGTGTWGHIAAGPDTMWVDPSYSGGDGVGSQAQPFTTIAAALAAVPAAGRVALAAGSYDEPVHLDAPVELVGRCPSLVTISGTQTTSYWYGQEDEVIVWVEATVGVAIRNVSISGAGYGVLAVAATLTLEGVHIHEATGNGVLAREGAEVSVERCLLEHTQGNPGQPMGLGFGMWAHNGGRLSVSNSALVGNRGGGLEAEQQSSVTAVGVLIESMLPKLDGYYGHCVHNVVHSQVHVSSSALVDCCEAGVYSEHGVLELVDSLAERMRVCRDGGSATGVLLRTSDSHVRVTGCAIIDNPDTGIATNTGFFEARGNLVRGNSVGVSVTDGSRATLAHNAVVDSEQIGVLCTDNAPGLLIESNLIEANGMAEPPGFFVSEADGLAIYYAEDALLRGNAVVENFGAGIAVIGGSAYVEHNLVEASRSTHLTTYRNGEGLELSGAVVAQVDGLAALGNTTRGLWLGSAGQQAAVVRSLIAGTAPRPFDGELGCGVVVGGGGDTSFEDVVITDNHLAAMLVHGSSATLRRVRLADTREGAFTSLACPTKPCTFNKETVHHGIADGLIAASSTVHLSDVQVSGCSRAGVLFHASSGTVDRITSMDNGFGLVLQGSPLPDVVAESCVFAPNTDQDVLTDSDLAIPDGSSDLPEAGQ